MSFIDPNADFPSSNFNDQLNRGQQPRFSPPDSFFPGIVSIDTNGPEVNIGSSPQVTLTLDVNGSAIILHAE